MEQEEAERRGVTVSCAQQLADTCHSCKIICVHKVQTKQGVELSMGNQKFAGHTGHKRMLPWNRQQVWAAKGRIFFTKKTKRPSTIVSTARDS
jgi:hypothetical protein